MKIIESSTILPEHATLLADQHRNLYHSASDFNDLDLTTKAHRIKGNLFSQNISEKAFCQRWPNPNDRNSPRHQQKEKIWSRRNPIVSRQTSITSLGSCFAIETPSGYRKTTSTILSSSRLPWTTAEQPEVL